jgi:hypothetical protein
MAKLNQIIAISPSKKSEGKRLLTEAYKRLQKGELFNGIVRTYKPLDDEGETFPDERKQMQYSVAQAIEEAREALTDLMNVVATQDVANTAAKSDVEVDGVTILSNVPVTHLLFLEKQVVDILTFVRHIPTLDPAEEWRYDDNSDCYASVPASSNKSKKIPKVIVKYEATPEHPAQVEMIQEDVKVGEWKTIKFSGAIPAADKNDLVNRIAKLQDALKFARERANSSDVTSVRFGEQVLDYIFGAKV